MWVLGMSIKVEKTQKPSETDMTLERSPEHQAGVWCHGVLPGGV